MRSVLVATVLALIAGCSSYPAHIPPEELAAPIRQDPDRIVLGPAAVGPDAGRAPFGIVVYPGGLVEPEAYAAPFAELAASGVPVVIVRMPLNLAVFGWRRIERALDDRLHASADRWVLAGHSLGGAMAARWVQRRNPTADLTVSGLIFLAAYPAESDAFESAGADEPLILSIWAEHDGLATESDRIETSTRLPDTARIAIIEGGNHAGFGSYGPQDGDGVATITSEEQWQEMTRLIQAYLEALSETR